MSASGRAVRRAFRPDPARIRPVRYRFALSGPAATPADVVLAPEGASFEIAASPQPDVVFNCSAATYAMVIFGRLKLDHAIEIGRVTTDSDAQLVSAFIAAFVGG